MATQSLYRRYRPRRFAELKGQDHVVRALRTSVAEGREGQAYLFSGPRGTGKTTSARILAKVLNCENPQDGEPCCECESCLSVERGTSYDVHELDAASNNGVEAMRDLIEKASLGTPGRHKVYILDEVHMLTKGAEAALLKTLEEPPAHVVFVLATTDPQKMSDTIRSRTQHLQFHLLPADTLNEHVKWVASDAGLEVTDEAIEQVLAQGGGSARDTLSALELVANAGGGASEVISLDEFAEAMIEHEPGRALTMAAHAISRGRDPRTLTEELIGFLRNGFLSLMAPELVQLPSQRLEALTELARRVGPAGLVRGIEQLGTALTDMRHAPDPRVLLDVAIVQLTSEAASSDLSGIVARLAKLERQIADGVPAGGGAAARPSAPVSAAAQAEATKPPADPATGRAPLGGRAKRAAATAPEPSPAPDATPAAGAATPPAAESAPAAEAASAPPADDVTAPIPVVDAASETPPAAPAEPDAAAPVVSNGEVKESDWDQIKGGLRGITRALFAPSVFVSAGLNTLTIGLPNDSHRAKCEQHRDAIETALSQHMRSKVTLTLVDNSGGGGPGGDGGGSDSPPPDPSGAGPAERAPERAAPAGAAESGAAGANLRAVPDAASGRAIAEQARQSGPEPDPDEALVPTLAALPDDDEIDLDDLVDAPPETVKTPIDRLADAFPGSELVDDIY
jgi:DNA polymerase III subunit gamma/tau